MDAQLLSDIRLMVTRPMLVSDLMDDLRHGPNPRKVIWKRLPHPVDFAAELEKNGFFIRSRTHGAGSATYVSPHDFESVKDRWGKIVSVYR